MKIRVIKTFDVKSSEAFAMLIVYESQKVKKCLPDPSMSFYKWLKHELTEAMDDAAETRMERLWDRADELLVQEEHDADITVSK